VKAVALFDIVVVVERLEQLPNLGHPTLEILTPTEVDQQEVHICGSKLVRSAQGIPDRHDLDFLATHTQHGINLGTHPFRAWSDTHVANERLEAL
jgi:hypothetical protein